jgi:hypothetical protein
MSVKCHHFPCYSKDGYFYLTKYVFDEDPDRETIFCARCYALYYNEYNRIIDRLYVRPQQETSVPGRPYAGQG